MSGKFWEFKLSDIIIILFAAATVFAAFWIGSSEDKQNKEIAGLGIVAKNDTTQIAELLELAKNDTDQIAKLIDLANTARQEVDKLESLNTKNSGQLRSLKQEIEQLKAIAAVQQSQVDILKKDYLRVSGDSASQYINDSLDWILTVYKIAAIGASIKNWPITKQPAADMLPQFKKAVYDTVAQLVNLFEVVLHNNKYFNSRHLLQHAVHQYAGFLVLANLKLANNDVSYEATSWAIGKSFDAWSKYVHGFLPDSEERYKVFMRELSFLVINPAAGH